MQHFIIDAELSAPNIQITDKNIAHQMKNVLRFKVGEEIIVLDGNGKKAKGQITELHKKGAVIELGETEVLPAPKRRLRLYVGLSKKPSTFELIVQKATELGVTDIIPLAAERCQVKHLRKLERLEMIIKEASEQCERAYLPKLHDVTLINEIAEGLTLVGDARDTDIELSKIEFKERENINLVIGPEGGLTENEITELRKSGAKIFLLGENILRMETAAIAALSVIQFG